MKKVIAVDFDDVLMDFHPGFMQHHNRLYGTTLTYEQLTDYDNWERIYGNDKETMKERALSFYQSPEHHLVEPVVGAIDATKHLAPDYSLQIVTSRPDVAKDGTLSWLDKHFTDLFIDFHFTNIYGGKAGVTTRKKSEVCQEIGAEILIDDAFRHACDVAQAGIPALLLDRPWNQRETGDKIHRVHTWDEIVRWIKTNV